MTVCRPPQEPPLGPPSCLLMQGYTPTPPPPGKTYHLPNRQPLKGQVGIRVPVLHTGGGEGRAGQNKTAFLRHEETHMHMVPPDPLFWSPTVDQSPRTLSRKSPKYLASFKMYLVLSSVMASHALVPSPGMCTHTVHSIHPFPSYGTQTAQH